MTSSVEEHDAGEPQQDLGVAPEGQRLIQPEKGLDQRRQCQDGQGQDQGYLEAAPVVGDHRAMIVARVCTAVAVMAAGAFRSGCLRM